jgi:hypothetical protein
MGNSVLTLHSLGFLVGPLLMHMGEREAFCVLVRYDEIWLDLCAAADICQAYGALRSEIVLPS